ncbi:MAG: C2H2-type zinc finger protein [Candidatus Aenigmatarchaeota archaeon]
MEENVFSVPLDVKKVERRNRAARAVREIKKFAMKQTDKDIKLDQDLNDRIWKRGAQKPPSSIRIRLVDAGEYVLVQPPEKELPLEEEFECEECGKTFSTEQGLEVHRSRAHEEEEEEVEEEEEEEEELYICDECGREFETKRGLSIHQSQLHEKVDEQEKERYEDILGGTIGEAKESIDDLENPDFELLLELEEENKNRKGMKEFIESQMD